MILWAVGVYTEFTGKNEVKIVSADSDIRVIQKAVDGFFDIANDRTTIQNLKNHYWESRQIVISDPVYLRKRFKDEIV